MLSNDVCNETRYNGGESAGRVFVNYHKIYEMLKCVDTKPAEGWK